MWFNLNLSMKNQSHSQYVNSSPPSPAYMRQWSGLALVQKMACRLFRAKPLSKPMLIIHWTLGNKLRWILIKIHNFWFIKCTWKYRLRNGVHFVQDVIIDNMIIPCVARISNDTNISPLKMSIFRLQVSTSIFHLYTYILCVFWRYCCW